MTTKTVTEKKPSAVSLAAANKAEIKARGAVEILEIRGAEIQRQVDALHDKLEAKKKVLSGMTAEFDAADKVLADAKQEVVRIKYELGS